MSRAMPLRLQLLLLQAVIVCVTVAITGAVAGAVAERSIRTAFQDRMLAVAQSVARLPAIVDAMDDSDPARTIQPVAEVIREASDVAYVVVTDTAGIRYSHPDPSRLYQRVSTDPSVPLSGHVYVGTQTGTLGTTWRVKVPIRDAGGAVIGSASVGILESELSAAFQGDLVWLVLAVVAAAVVGLFGAAGVTALIRRRTYRLEPREIAALMQDRDTMLHRLSEGVVVVAADGRVALANDAAGRLLGTSADGLVGAAAADVLGDDLVAVLAEGEAAGRAVVVGDRVLIARSTGATVADRPVEATVLLRDHTELHDLLDRIEAADAILAFRARPALPKGLSPETLARIRGALDGGPASASDVAGSTGLSRVSARRYLEHLASTGGAVRELDYGTRGRPGARYRATSLDRR